MEDQPKEETKEEIKEEVKPEEQKPSDNPQEPQKDIKIEPPQEKTQDIDSTDEEKERKEKEERVKKEKEEKERKEKEEMEKKTFEKNMWNKYEFLHKRYKKKIECFENTIEIFSRLLSSLKDHQKVINTIISKNYCLFPQGESTQSYTINLIKKGLESEFNQLQSNLELLKKILIDQFKKHKDEAKVAEKDTYNQLLKTLSRYTDSKTILEKNKTKYHQSVKVAELALKNSKEIGRAHV